MIGRSLKNELIDLERLAKHWLSFGLSLTPLDAMKPNLALLGYFEWRVSVEIQIIFRASQRLIEHVFSDG